VKNRRTADNGRAIRSTSKEVDLPRIENAVREILLAIGEDPEREGLLETPARVARMYAEVFAGLRVDPRALLQRAFTQKYDEMVLVRDISFESMCEHHLMPFTGRAQVAYIPNGKVVGLSKIPRTVEVFARRPQIQEQMTEQIADLLMDELEARGVAVILEASHACVAMRGIRKTGAVMTTSAMRGVFKDNVSTRNELLALINAPR
jgi:GTP cyclohydrolase I